MSELGYLFLGMAVASAVFFNVFCIMRIDEPINRFDHAFTTIATIVVSVVFGIKMW